jgi:hypothetical protein
VAFSLRPKEKEKEFQRNILKYFWSFGFSEASKLMKRKQKREKLFTRESSQQAKEEREYFLDFIKVFQTNKKKARKIN